MKVKMSLSNLVACAFLSLSTHAASANDVVEMVGDAKTRCAAKEIEYRYDFKGYISTLSVGDSITVYNSLTSHQGYGSYRVDSLDLRSGQVGTVNLSHKPRSQNGITNEIDFGDMTIEYFSIHALKDIKVTFTKDSVKKSSWVNCTAD